ncbi:MAG: carbohydrate kinase family protein [Chloroflexia bacterium]|nr:carbohydrate kinase family protein [Chloroflexia bacterium]
MSDELERPIAIVGNLNVDQIVSTVTRFPEWDEELIVQSSRLELAGTAGYLALAARRLGLRPFVVSTVGADANGDFLRRELAVAGIDDTGVETIPELPTCLGMVFVGDRGQRGILTVLGAHERMTVAVAERHDAAVSACAEVFLCGNFLLPRFSPRLAAAYARRLRARGQVVVFDPSWDPGGWCPDTRADTLALLDVVNLFMPNEEELCRLTGTTTWRDGVAAIGPRPDEIVVKRGARGAVSVTSDRVVAVAGLPVEAVNTTGAGDVFDMSYVYARRQGWETRQCLEFACAAAACIVSQTGSRTYPDEREVRAFAARISPGLV